MGLSIYATLILVAVSVGIAFGALKAASIAAREATEKPLTRVTIIFWMVVIGLLQLIIIVVKFHPLIYIAWLFAILVMMILTIRPPRSDVWENPFYRFVSWAALSAIPLISLFMSIGEREDGWNIGLGVNVLLYIIFPIVVEVIVGGALLVYCYSKKPAPEQKNEDKKEDNTPDAVPASAT